ncbi:hypothetical protein CBR_g24194 [Chara braunii]|uniref:Uncharacterized protein n=1 Tax=Chara braunii TaxID=69332 RepID=A0A388L623_CHABU|nr:hypothetical protein CBR_g24194 [Chara braunii]|eukprot:GBG77747.1 hypothetical protein CBR_g24194 [Chara braunii]
METMAELQQGGDDWLATMKMGCQRLQAVVGVLLFQMQKGLVVDGGAMTLGEWLDAHTLNMLDILWELEEGPDPQFDDYMDWRRVEARMGVCQALFREGRDLRYQMEDGLEMDDTGVDGERPLCHLDDTVGDGELLDYSFGTMSESDNHRRLDEDSNYTSDVIDLTIATSAPKMEDRLEMDDTGVDGELPLCHLDDTVRDGELLDCSFGIMGGSDNHQRLNEDSNYTSDVIDLTIATSTPTVCITTVSNIAQAFGGEMDASISSTTTTILSRWPGQQVKATWGYLSGMVSRGRGVCFVLAFSRVGIG